MGRPWAPTWSMTRFWPGSGPGEARVRGVVGQDGALDQTVRAVVGVIDLAVVLEPERLQVNDEMVLVRQRQADLADLGQRRHQSRSERVEHLLQRVRVRG